MSFKQKSAGEAMSEEASQIVAKMKPIVEAAKAEGRDFTADEAVKVKTWKRRLDEIAEWEDQAKAADAVMHRIKSHGPIEGFAEGVGDADGVKDGLARAVRSKGSFGFNMPMVKEALTVGAIGLPSTGQTVSDPLPATAAVALRDLFDQQAAASGSVRYYTVSSGSADVVAEGGLKPDLGANVEGHNAELVKLATTFSFTDELAEDANWMVSHITREAIRAILVRENALIVAALDATTGALTSTGPVGSAIDVVAGAIGAAEATNGVTPARVVLNPLDLAEVRTAKASTGGSYHVDPLAAGPSTIHGVPLVATPAVAQGSGYMLSPGVGVFYSRNSGLRVETGFTGDDWVHNRVTTRVEERVLPAVIRPSLLTKITFEPEA